MSAERLSIAVEGLVKSFPNKRPALRGVDLTVAEGEVVAVVGPNGAGKTTLLKILATLILPDAGNVLVGGASALKEPECVKSTVSLLIADERSFYARLTGRQNLEFYAALLSLSPREARERIDRTAELLEIDTLEKPYQECSTGGKQRLALARCLLNKADILLMDEPTRSLDPDAAKNLRRIVREALKGEKRAILFTTHQPAEAAELAHRVVTLKQGVVAGVKRT